MPITIKHGSIFDSTAQVLVCPVNCVGVMGKGLALEFKKRFPMQSDYYQLACRNKWLVPGIVLTVNDIAFATTKNHWRNPSEIDDVDSCLVALRGDIESCGKSIALPQLGCGCGGLDWADVWPLYEKHLGGLPVDVEVWIYE